MGGGCMGVRSPPEGNVRGPFTRNETEDVTWAMQEPVNPSSLRTCCLTMSAVTPVFHTVVTLKIGLKTQLSVRTLDVPLRLTYPS